MNDQTAVVLELKRERDEARQLCRELWDLAAAATLMEDMDSRNLLDAMPAWIHLENSRLGYTCQTCGASRPREWYIYEIERKGESVTPCCAICARKEKSRGPFPQNGNV